VEQSGETANVNYEQNEEESLLKEIVDVHRARSTLFKAISSQDAFHLVFDAEIFRHHLLNMSNCFIKLKHR
jgi:hypothetical protein